MMNTVAAVAFLLAVSIVPAPLQELAGCALAAPPEIAADILIRITESPQVSDRDWRLELLENAFQLAGSARHPLKRVTAVAVPDPEAVWSVFDRKLDGLSLQVRAVRALLPLDADRAAAAFHRIVLPRIAPLACKEALGYSLHDYYALAAELFPHDSAGILALVRGMNSVWELEPVARMLTRVWLPADDWELAVLAYASTLRQMTADDRSFSAVIGSMEAPVRELGRRLRLRVVADAWDLFVSRHRSEPRCTDPAFAALAVSIKHPVLDDADLLLGPARLR
jgi:hypothetical protein